MKEFGGYFELEQFKNEAYYQDLIHLNTARNALLYIMKSKKIRKVYIPYYLCHSIKGMLARCGYEYEYYEIAADFTPIFNQKLVKQEALYIVNYFGQLSNEKIARLKEQHQQIIVDNTHAFFQRPLSSVDTIYSCRKFFGVPDGAYLATDQNLAQPLELDYSKERMGHLLGRYEGSAADYYHSFLEVDEHFSEEPLKQMSNMTRNLMGAIDYHNVIKIRNRNYRYLESVFKPFNEVHFIAPNGPFCYPFYTKNAVQLRRDLAKKKIYIPQLWPNVLRVTSEESIEYQYSANILPIPCDQRYDLEDMKYIVACLNSEEQFTMGGANNG